MLSCYTIFKDKKKEQLIHCVHDVTHITVATASNWRLMSFNPSHKLFLEICELPLQLPTPRFSRTPFFLLSGNNDAVSSYF